MNQTSRGSARLRGRRAQPPVCVTRVIRTRHTPTVRGYVSRCSSVNRSQPGPFDSRPARRDSPSPYTALSESARSRRRCCAVRSTWLRRLGLAPAHCTPLDPERFVPAVGQGIIALEARLDDLATLARLAQLDHAPTRACAEAERAYLTGLGASCTTPVAAHAQLDGATLRMSAIVAADDGQCERRGAGRRHRSARPPARRRAAGQRRGVHHRAESA